MRSRKELVLGEAKLHLSHSATPSEDLVEMWYQLKIMGGEAAAVRPDGDRAAGTEAEGRQGGHGMTEKCIWRRVASSC